MPDEDAEARRRRLDHYADTILEVGTWPRFEVDLRFPLPASAGVAFPFLGLGDAFAVITAENPEDRELSAVQNQERTTALHRELVRRGLFLRVAIGRAADGSHHEHGFAVRCSLREALELGRRFGQHAVFWVSGGEAAVVEVAGDVFVHGLGGNGSTEGR